MKTSHLLSIPFTMLVLALLSACNRGNSYSFFNETVRSTEIYRSGSETEVREALVNFVKNAEAHLESMQSEKRLDYAHVMGLSYLRLAGIYRVEHQQKLYADAISHSIQYFKEDPHIAADEQFKKDAEGFLLKWFLDAPEKLNPPKWRQAN